MSTDWTPFTTLYMWFINKTQLSYYDRPVIIRAITSNDIELYDITTGNSAIGKLPIDYHTVLALEPMDGTTRYPVTPP